jgi:hypothetical protein
MPDQKLTGLSEQASPATTDLLYLVRPGGPSSYKVTVDNILALAGVGVLAVDTITGNTTLDDDYDVINVNNTAVMTVTLPTAVGREGKQFVIRKISGNGHAVTIDGDGTETIEGLTTWPIYHNRDQVHLISDGANWLILNNIIEQKRLTTTDDTLTEFWRYAIPADTLTLFQYHLFSTRTGGTSGAAGDGYFEKGLIWGCRESTNAPSSISVLVVDSGSFNGGSTIVGMSATADSNDLVLSMQGAIDYNVTHLIKIEKILQSRFSD